MSVLATPPSATREPALPPAVEQLFDAWDRVREQLAPLAPFVRLLLEAWGAADRAWSQAATADALATQWTCRLLFDAVHAQERALPAAVRSRAIAAGILSFDDVVEATARLGEGPSRDGHTGDLASVWCSLFDAAGDDETLLARAIDAMDAARPDARRGTYADCVAIECLTRLGHIDAAFERCARVDSPFDRVRVVTRLAPHLDATRRACALEAAWDLVQCATHPDAATRAGLLGALIDPDRASATRLRALVALVEGLPEEDLEASQDHEDLRLVVARALADAGEVGSALEWVQKIPRSDAHHAVLADAAGRLPEPHRTRIAREVLAQASAGLLGDDGDLPLLRRLARLSPTVAAECLGLVAEVAPRWDAAAVVAVELAAHFPAAAPSALRALVAAVGAGDAPFVRAWAALSLDAIAALAPHAPSLAAEATEAVAVAALDASPVDPHDLAILARRAPAAFLSAVIDGFERAADVHDVGECRLHDRSALCIALGELRARREIADDSQLETRVRALGLRLARAADLLNDNDPDTLDALPVAVRTTVLREILCASRHRVTLALEHVVSLRALEPHAPDVSYPVLAATARALARDTVARADVDAVLAASEDARRAVMLAADARDLATVLAGLARGGAGLPRRLPDGWRVWLETLRDATGFAAWRARQPDGLRTVAPAAPTRAGLAQREAEIADADRVARGSSRDADVWNLARGWMQHGDFARARAVLPWFDWGYHRDLCAVEIACAEGEITAAQRALSIVLEPPAFFTTPDEIAAHAAAVPDALYAIASRAPSPGLREALQAHLLAHVHDERAWAHAGLARATVCHEIAAAFDEALAHDREIPDGAVPLAFAYLPVAMQRRAWHWAFGVEARARARWHAYPPVAASDAACALVGVHIAPVLAAIEARLGASVGGYARPAVALR